MENELLLKIILGLLIFLTIINILFLTGLFIIYKKINKIKKEIDKEYTKIKSLFETFQGYIKTGKTLFNLFKKESK